MKIFRNKTIGSKKIIGKVIVSSEYNNKHNHHEGHYITADEQHYVTADNMYYTVK